jgi:glucosamine--fructose-6-phosphate aminotransferase (isomerizing)
MSIDAGFYTRQEIFSQPQAWTSALNVADSGRQAILALGFEKFDQILFTGCGSTYYLALAAASLTQSSWLL